MLSKNRKIKINSTSCWSHVKWKPVSEPPRNPWNFYWSAFLSELQCCYGPENRARAFSLRLAGWDTHARALGNTSHQGQGWPVLGSLLRWKSEAFQMGRCNALWYRPDLNTSGSRCSWSLHKKPQKPLKPSNIMKHLGIHPQSIIFLNIMAHFNNSILEIFTNNLVTYLYGFALKLWYA